MLNLLQKIKDESMDMQFRIEDVQEKYRTLNNYGLIKDNYQQYQNSLTLKDEWADVIKDAHVREQRMKETKKLSAIQTRQVVAKFENHLKLEYNKFKKEGPGSPDINLKEGLK